MHIIFFSSLKLLFSNLYKLMTAFLENFNSDIEDLTLDTLITGNLEVNLRSHLKIKRGNIIHTHQEGNAS